MSQFKHSYIKSSNLKLSKRQDTFFHTLVQKQIKEHLLDFKYSFDCVLEIQPVNNFNYFSEDTKKKKVLLSAFFNGFLPSKTNVNKSKVVFPQLPPLLPFKSETFDIVIGNFAFENFSLEEKTYFFNEVNRVLKSDGLFVGSFFAENNLNQLKLALSHGDAQTSNNIYQRIHPGINYQALGQTLTDSKFKLPVIKIEEITLGYTNIYKALNDIKNTFGSNCLEGRKKTFTTKNTLKKANKYLLDNFCQNNQVRITSNFLLSFAWKHHDKQQKPKAKGSGKFSFDKINEKFNKP